jgi:membrane protease subunit (stomatin/prohibitin family)
MGIMDFVRGGVREMMIARPDSVKHLLVYKHRDQNLPFWAQLTVDSDECALFFRDGQYKGNLPPGRHTLMMQNIPFLGGLLDNPAGGDRFVADVFFAKMQPVRGIPFNGPLEPMEDPILHERVTPRVSGEFAVVVVDPVRFVTGFRGQAGAQDQDAILGWIKGLFFKAVKTVIGQVCVDRKQSLVNVGAMTMEIAGRLQQSAPNLDEIGVRVLEIGGFNIHFSAEEQKLLRDAERARGEVRGSVGIAADVARAKELAVDPKFAQNASSVQDLAARFPGYAAGAGLPAMPPQWLPPHLQQPAPPQAPPQAPPAAGGAPTIEQRLTRLTELKAKGLISDEDFQARKAKILEDL